MTKNRERPPEVPADYIFSHETRWSRVFRNSGEAQWFVSKFRSGEVSITLDELIQGYDSWTSQDRSDFVKAFHTDDVALSKGIFKFFISRAIPDERFRYSDVFRINRDSNEAIETLSTWLDDPTTVHAHCLFVGLIYVAQQGAREKAISLLERTLAKHATEEFWGEVAAQTVKHERAKLVVECLAALGWLQKGEISIPFLKKLEEANIPISKRARELLESSKRGQWSLSA